MQLLAMAMARWVLPVPVPPTSTALRCWAMKPPPARSCTSVSLIGVFWNWKSSRSLASGSLAMVSWYLIERACFSLGFVLAFDGGSHDLVEGGLQRAIDLLQPVIPASETVQPLPRSRPVLRAIP